MNTTTTEKVFSKTRIRTAYTIWAGCSILSLIYTSLYFYELASGASWFHILLSIAFGIIVVEGFKQLCFHGAVDSGGRILLYSKSLALSLVLVAVSLLATQAFFHTRSATTTSVVKRSTFDYSRLVEKRANLIKDADALRAAIDTDLKSGKYRSRGLRRRDAVLKPLLEKIDEIDKRLDKAAPEAGGENQFATSVSYWTGASHKQAEFWSVLFFALLLELGQFYGIWVATVGNKFKKQKEEPVPATATVEATVEPRPSNEMRSAQFASVEAEPELIKIPQEKKESLPIIKEVPARTPRQLTRVKSSLELDEDERKKADDLINTLLKKDGK